MTTCPVSYIEPCSMTLLEQHAAWRIEGHRELATLPARRADAFMVLEEEIRKENVDAKR